MDYHCSTISFYLCTGLAKVMITWQPAYCRDSRPATNSKLGSMYLASTYLLHAFNAVVFIQSTSYLRQSASWKQRAGAVCLEQIQQLTHQHVCRHVKLDKVFRYETLLYQSNSVSVVGITLTGILFAAVRRHAEDSCCRISLRICSGIQFQPVQCQ